MLFKKLRTIFYVYKLIDREVNDKYTMKIWAGIGMDCDQNSDAKAKNELVRMIVKGEIEKDNIEEICNAYMGVRESIVMENGGMAEWVEK